jgi:hypothetical protein
VVPASCARATGWAGTRARTASRAITAKKARPVRAPVDGGR